MPLKETLRQVAKTQREREVPMLERKRYARAVILHALSRRIVSLVGDVKVKYVEKLVPA